MTAETHTPSPARSSPPNVRYEVLDGMRGVAAIAVCIYHLTLHTLHPVFTSARFAVDLFFCLSGFVVAHAYTQRLQNGLSTGDFLRKRLARLYPMFLVGIGIGAAALLVKLARHESSLSPLSTLAAIALNALYVPFVSHDWVQVGMHRMEGALFPTNDPGWSLFFELLVNLGFAFIVVHVGNARRVMVVMTLLAALGLVAWCAIEQTVAPGWGADNMLGGLPRSIYGFFAGVLLYGARIRLKLNTPPALLMVLLVGAFATVATSPNRWLAATLVLSPVLVFLGSRSEVSPGGRQEATLRWLGDISYPLYCIHFPLYSIAATLIDSSLATSIASVLASIGLAHLLNRHVEGIATRKLNALFARKPHAAG